MTKRELIIVGIIAAVLITIIVFAAKEKYGENDDEAYTMVDDINKEQREVLNIQNYGNTYDNSTNTIDNSVNTKQKKELEKLKDINIKINGTTYVATLYDNEASKELIQLLPYKLTMSEMNKNEKYSYINTSFTMNPEKVTEIKKGDILLYESNCLTIFYNDLKTERMYTKIGKIENTEGMDDLLNYDNVEVELSNIEQQKKVE